MNDTNLVLKNTILENVKLIVSNDEVVIEEDLACTGCSACKSVCPQNAISMEYNEKGFLYPFIDLDKCTYCGLCKTVCSNCEADANGKETKDFDAIPTYAVRNKLVDERMNSQSGGAFYNIAKRFFTMTQNSVVYGVALTTSREKNEAYYTRIDNEEELHVLRRSKYVSANSIGLYEKILLDLNEQKDVLVSGLPCIIHAVKKYLKERVSCEKLYLIDLICHGTPSPVLFSEYMDCMYDIYGDIKDYKFRDKQIAGWHPHQESFCNMKGYRIYDDIYSVIFNLNLAHRDSCYQCRYSSLNRPGDITLGDCWHSEKILPEWQDERGISLVLVNSEKGKNMVRLLSDDMEVRAIPLSEVMQINLRHPTNKPDNIDEFWRDYEKKGIKYVLSKYGKKEESTLINQIVVHRLAENLKKGIIPTDYLEKRCIKNVVLCGSVDNNQLMKKTLELGEIGVLGVIDLYDEMNSEDDLNIPVINKYMIEKMRWEIVDAIILTDNGHISDYIMSLNNMGVPVEKLLPMSFICNNDMVR